MQTLVIALVNALRLTQVLPTGFDSGYVRGPADEDFFKIAAKTKDGIIVWKPTTLSTTPIDAHLASAEFSDETIELLVIPNCKLDDRKVSLLEQVGFVRCQFHPTEEQIETGTVPNDDHYYTLTGTGEQMVLVGEKVAGLLDI